MIFTIKKGKHSAGLFTFPVFHPKRLSYRITFLEGYDYEIEGEDQKDWNKLFGYSYGFNAHKNSVRFAWRWNKDVKAVEVCPYAYWKGRVLYKEHGTTSTFLQNGDTLTIDQCFSHTVFWVERNGVTVLNNAIVRATKCPFGFFLKPYFGGNRPSPKTVKIKFEKVK